jgi:MbtH protein
MIWDNPEQIFLVVVNDEEQYSIWPDFKDIPLGWRRAGKEGSKDECLSFINTIWTDMRPLSLRRAMEAQDAEPAA